MYRMQQVRIPFGAALAIAVVVTACSQPPADQEPTAQVDTLSDRRVLVANTGVSSWTPETAWRLEEDLKLGTEEGEGPESEWFSRIMSVVSDSRGMIYVLDYPAGLMVFHPSGAFSHTIGREGEGPGELAGAIAMAVGPGDTLWVTDPGEGRYSLFAPDGRFVRVHRMRTNGYDILGTVLRDGSYVDWSVALPEGPARVVLHPVRLGPSAERVDSLPPLEFMQELRPDGNPQVLFNSMLTGAVDRSGSIWFVHTREYRIYRRSLDGDTTLVFDLPARAAPVEETDREAVRRFFSRMPPERLASMLEELPKTKPLVNRIIPDGAGHIYVLSDVAGEPAGSIVDVFRESGEYVGRMTLPKPVSLFPPPVVAHATRDHLYIVIQDELDVSYVLRLRIVRGVE